MDQNQTGSIILNITSSVLQACRVGRLLALLSGTLLFSACSSVPPPPVSKGHLQAPSPVSGAVPEYVAPAPVPPKPPKPAQRQELYTVVMQNVAVQDLLFALARDAQMNVDIHPAIAGTVTMNVRDQTLLEVLERVARQVDLRYEVQGRNISILPDTPYLKNYRVEYPNIQRDANANVATSTNVASTGSGGSATGSNASTATIVNTTNNRFWVNLVANVRDLLRETDKVLSGDGGSSSNPVASGGSGTSNPIASGGGSPGPAAAGANAAAAGIGRAVYREAASVIAHQETGTLSVRATQAQHQRIGEFLERVMRSARRQVLIEATIVEVDLSNRYQQGIDWSLVASGGTNTDPGVFVGPTGSSSGLATGGLVSGLLRITRTDTNAFDGRDLTMMLNLLESFGTLRVLSSPKISVLNNQSSVLKVVDNKVYFTISVTPGTPATTTTAATPATYTSTVNTVPVGFLMNVVPQISESNEVTLNLRPTISRITGYATDPNPALAQNSIVNRIPEIQTREMESILRVPSGGVAMLGGLMQDSRNNLSDEVPGINRVPFLGNLFKYRDETSKKTELVIFLRPTVLQDPTLDGDYRDYRNLLSEAQEGLNTPASPARPEFSISPQ